METTVSSQAKKQKKRVACIGRWMPIHNGHKKFLVELAKSDQYAKVIIMIGSCYEGGNIRNCITATDIRNMIVNGDYEKLETLIPNEIKPILYRYTFKEIVAASQNRGINFIKGRQTVDLILLVKDVIGGYVYVLLGNRPKSKKDFPDVLALPGDKIRLFETATDTAIRTFYEETGLKIKMIDNSLEPAIVKFENVSNTSLEQMHIVGIYGSEDKELNGTKGGSSQCFAILVEGDVLDYQKQVNPQHGLTAVRFLDARVVTGGYARLAFQHREMIKKAIQMLEAYPDLAR